MKRNLLWRGLLILVLLASALWRLYPPRETINLGLDLQGGIHLLLQVQTLDALRAENDKDQEILLREGRKEGLQGLVTQREGDNAFTIRGVGAEGEATLGRLAADLLPGYELDRRGDEWVARMRASYEKSLRDLAVEQALQTIRNRIDQFGVAEPLIARQGIDSDRIVVQLPGVDDPDRVKRLIKNTAFLEFRLLDYPRAEGGLPTKEAILQHYGGVLPAEVEILPQDLRDAQGNVIGQNFYAVERRRVITGRDLRSAAPSRGDFGQPVVQFMLSPEGAQLFGKATGENVGRGLAIVLDGRVVSAPRINSRITDSGIIEGQFTDDEVRDLVTTLRSGALPAGIVYLEDRTVGPTLGQDSIEAGVKAGLAGALLVVLSMLIVYRLSGVNAVVALGINIALIFGALAYFGATLTLPGIAGIVLTIGMAVDASVLVFERIKEELRGGRTARAAIDAGFKNALSSIVDANVTTLIAALFLFQFGTGPIRGFAVTLSLGILGTLFCGVFVSRWLFDVVFARAIARDGRLSI